MDDVAAVGVRDGIGNRDDVVKQLQSVLDLTLGDELPQGATSDQLRRRTGSSASPSLISGGPH
jgi:hypothetical protein